MGLIDLILYVPSTIFQLNRDDSSWVEPRVKARVNVSSLKDHNAVMPVRLEPATSRSRVKHSTTEPLCSLQNFLTAGKSRAKFSNLSVSIGKINKMNTANLFFMKECGQSRDQTNGHLVGSDTLLIELSNP